MEVNNKETSNKQHKRLSWKSVLPIVCLSTAISSGISAGIAYGFAKGFSYDVPTFTATFVNWDDSVLATVNNIQLGEKVVIPEAAKNPTRPYKEGEWTNWTFTGWDNDVESGLLKNMTFKAQYKGVHEMYTAYFYDGIDESNPIGHVDNISKGEEPSDSTKIMYANKATERKMKNPGLSQYVCSGWQALDPQGSNIIRYKAIYDQADNGLLFESRLDGDIVVQSFINNNSLDKVTIPKTWGGKPVVEIKENAFSNEQNETLKNVVIPSTISSIGDGAFKGCKGLKTVTFDEKENTTLSIINKDVFNSTGLEQIELPDSVTKICDSVFENCSNLKSVKFGLKVNDISTSCLNNCPNLTNIYLNPNNVTYSTDAKSQLLLKYNDKNQVSIIKAVPKIESIDFGSFKEKLISIDDYAFEGCLGITSIDFSKCSSLTEIGVGSFANCSNLTSINIGNVEYLPKNCFKDCTSLSVLSIGSKINWNNDYIDATSLDGCKNLTEIQTSNPALTTQDGVLYTVDKKTILRCPPQKSYTSSMLEGTENIGNYAFKWNIATNITLPNGIKNVGKYAFDSCENLTTFSFSDTVLTIGEGSLLDCKQLISLHFGASNTYDAQYMDPTFLNGCDSLSEFSVDSNNQSMTTTDDGLLITKPVEGFSNVTLCRVPPNKRFTNDTLTLPDNVNYIGAWALKECKINKLILSPITTFIDAEALSTTSLSEIEITANDDNVMPTFWEGGTYDDIEYNSCFYGARVDNLKFIIDHPSLYGKPQHETELTFAFEKLQSINDALNKAKSDRTKTEYLINLVLKPDSTNGDLTTLFEGCRFLKQVNFADEVKTIVSYAFNFCRNLSFVNLNKVEQAGNQAFSNCSALCGDREDNMIIPGTMTTVPFGFFAESNNIKKLTVSEGVQTIRGSVCLRNTNLETVDLPKTIINLGESIFELCSNLKTINYAGTKEDWNGITIHANAFSGCRATVICSDGTKIEVGD